MAERLTEKFKDGRNILRKGIENIHHIGFGQFYAGEAIDKLSEYETAEEEGRLVVLPCEVAWYIVNKGTPYAMIMPVSINILRIIEIRNIDIDGIYYSTHEKAEKALKEMEVKE